MRLGGKVPADGAVTEGTSAVDACMLTGEPLPVCERAGGKLICAALNTGGALAIRSERVNAQTMLSRIVQMVALAQRSKATTQRRAELVAGRFETAVVAIAALTFLACGFTGPDRNWVYEPINAVAVLVIACPCALGLATPTSIMVATGRAATHGILFRDAAVIERFRKVGTLIVEKTGTPTVGKPSFKRAVLAQGFSAEEVLRLAASLDQGSEHPLADVIVRAARELGRRSTRRRGSNRVPASAFVAWCADVSSRSATLR